MTKAERQQVFDKCGGKCAYCGCVLQKGWHVDHVEPIRRYHKIEGCTYEGATVENPFGNGVFIPKKRIPTCVNPEADCMDNYMPACASCNINKHSMSLEGFRNLIAGFIKSLNRDSTQYKFAKRYGLVQETEKPVVFYFETIPQ